MIKETLKFVADYGFTVVFAVFMLKWLVGDLKKKSENEKNKLEMIIDQNKQFLEHFIKDSKDRAERFEKIVDKLADERELTHKQFEPIISLATRLLKNRLCERINQIINRNNLIINQQEIVHEIDNIFMSEINFIEVDLSDIRYSSKNDLYNIYYHNVNYYIPLIKMVFAEIEPNDLIDREGYNRIGRRAVNFIEEFITDTRKDINEYYKK